MKPRVSKKEAMERATVGLKVLVKHQCLTRVRRSEAYKGEDGKFSLAKFRSQMSFLDSWDKRSLREKHKLHHKYAEYARAYNNTLNVDWQLVKKIVGGYADENGKWHAISPSEVIDQLVASGWLKVIEHGAKIRYDKDKHKYCQTRYWKRKFEIADEKKWFGLLSDDRYLSLATFPGRADDIYVQRAADIIIKYNSNRKPSEKPEKKEDEVKPVGKETPKQVAKPKEYAVDKKREIAAWLKQLLLEGKITEDKARETVMRLGADAEKTELWLADIRAKKEAQELAKLNAIAETPVEKPIYKREKKPSPPAWDALNKVEQTEIIDNILKDAELMGN